MLGTKPDYGFGASPSKWRCTSRTTGDLNSTLAVLQLPSDKCAPRKSRKGSLFSFSAMIAAAFFLPCVDALPDEQRITWWCDGLFSNLLRNVNKKQNDMHELKKSLFFPSQERVVDGIFDRKDLNQKMHFISFLYYKEKYLFFLQVRRWLPFFESFLEELPRRSPAPPSSVCGRCLQGLFLVLFSSVKAHCFYLPFFFLMMQILFRWKYDRIVEKSRNNI